MNKTIFIADDSPTILSYFKSILGTDKDDFNFFEEQNTPFSDYDIHTFEDGDLLLEDFKKFYDEGKNVPLCFLDMRMVRVDGLTTATELRKIDKDVQIIIITAYSDESIDEIKNQLQNDIYYIKKPFNEEELIVLVHSLINNWNTKNEIIELNKKFSNELDSLQNKVDKLQSKYKELQKKFDKNESIIEKLTSENNELHSKYDNFSENDTSLKKLKTAFLLNMSHELRTPLNAIVGFSELLGDPDLTDDQHNEYIELISQNGNSLLYLVDDIIDMSRIDSGSFTISKEMVLINNMLNDIYKESKIILQEQNNLAIDIKLINELEASKVLLTNEFRLKQVISKLIDNAVKYSKTGIIEFGIKLSKNNNKELLFFVKDNGLGMTETKLMQTFDLFSKYDDSYTRKYGGMRMSLHLTKKIIEILGGKIWVESELGEGTAFYFTIPDVQSSKTKIVKTKTTEHTKLYDWSEKNIIIAEDVEFNYIYLSEILRKTKANVLWAKNGLEALYLFDKYKKIDLVLMDLQMPVMNGFEATKEIKQAYPNVPVIAQTAYTIDEERKKSIDAGCVDFLSKPIKPNVLYNSIANHI